MKENAIINLSRIVVAFDGEPILKGIDLSIKDGEFVTLLGPSGCGKTTTLRIIAGFINPDDGDVFFNGVKINGVPPHKRQVNTVFQRYALFPNLNVGDNIAFGMNIKKKPKEETQKKVTEMLKLVGLTGFEKRRVTALSGGQQQRVAIARALANQPKVLLLDEPLGALDLKLRREMQRELKKIQHELGITFIYVTHDQEEALSMSDTVVVMNHGEIQQVGTPLDIYNEPQNAFVAKFIGESNIVDGIMLDDCKVRFCQKDFDCVDKGFATNEAVDVVIRPEDIKITPPGQGQIQGKMESVTFKGDYYEIFVGACNETWIIESTKAGEIGAPVGLTFYPDDIHIMKKSEYSGHAELPYDVSEVDEGEI